MKHEVSDELKAFYRDCLAAKRIGDGNKNGRGYRIDVCDPASDIDDHPTCDILRLAAVYRERKHLYDEHCSLLRKVYGNDYCPFTSFDNCASNPERLAFITKYAE